MANENVISIYLIQCYKNDIKIIHLSLSSLKLQKDQPSSYMVILN